MKSVLLPPRRFAFTLGTLLLLLSFVHDRFGAIAVAMFAISALLCLHDIADASERRAREWSS